VTHLHHSIQAAINKTIISLFERKLPLSNVTISRANSIALQVMTQFAAEQPQYCSYKNYRHDIQQYAPSRWVAIATRWVKWYFEQSQYVPRCAMILRTVTVYLPRCAMILGTVTVYLPRCAMILRTVTVRTAMCDDTRNSHSIPTAMCDECCHHR